MKVLAAISSPAQDDVIERILRAREEWDPPLPPDEVYIVDPEPADDP